jgi:hypothetical protein
MIQKTTSDKGPKRTKIPVLTQGPESKGELGSDDGLVLHITKNDGAKWENISLPQQT